jgi:hypothetical protein
MAPDIAKPGHVAGGAIERGDVFAAHSVRGTVDQAIGETDAPEANIDNAR